MRDGEDAPDAVPVLLTEADREIESDEQGEALIDGDADAVDDWLGRIDDDTRGVALVHRDWLGEGVVDGERLPETEVDMERELRVDAEGTVGVGLLLLDTEPDME